MSWGPAVVGSALCRRAGLMTGLGRAACGRVMRRGGGGASPTDPPSATLWEGRILAVTMNAGATRAGLLADMSEMLAT